MVLEIEPGSLCMPGKHFTYRARPQRERQRQRGGGKKGGRGKGREGREGGAGGWEVMHKTITCRTMSILNIDTKLLNKISAN